MLDLGRKYFVTAEKYPRSVLESWANENAMKVGDEEMTLSTYGRVYELDVQYNDALAVARGLLGTGYPNFLNRQRIIGKIATNRMNRTEYAVIYPEIKDR